ncbi:MAG: TonB-dependent receptor [Acidobacteria bacterium]|nr:MAG: TonB-dependent receptor [Acidobacteriota bacterium]
MTRPIVVTFLLLLALAAPLAAQFANGDVAGVVTDQDGAPLPGVTVTVRNEATGLARTTVTSTSGTYAVNGLRPGVYTVSFDLDGFQPVERPGVPVRVGQQTRINVTMQLGAVEETITVTGEAPLIETTSKEIGGTVTTQEFTTLPTQNRSALLFASILPGVIPSPSTESTASDALFINGQDDNNNSFNIDGANNDDDVIGARAGAQARTPMEAIQEFQVLTTQFDAEFGRALGGVLNAVTKSGGNEFKGNVFGFFQDSSLNEKNFFTERNNQPQPDDQFRSLGFILGGPIVQNKAFFFVSVEDNKDEEGVARSFATRPDLNFTTSEDNEIENVLLKADYQPVDNHHLAFRWLREESPQFNQIIGNVTLAAAREEADVDSNWTFSLESVIDDRRFNTLRVSFTKEDVAFANPGFNNNGQNFDAQRNQAPSEVHPGFVDGPSTVAQARINRSFQVDDTFNFFVPDAAGEHEIRLGFQYSDREEEFTNFGTLNGQFFNFETDQPFDPNDISTYPGAFQVRVLGGLTAPIPSNEVLGAFVQDDWRVNDRLTLNLGLRFDTEDITDDDNVAPRIGFAWDPWGHGETVVRGGYGRFYDRFQLGFFANFFLDAVGLDQGFILRFPDVGQNQQLFFDIAQQNGVTNLTQLRDVIVAMIEGGAGSVLNTRPTVDNPDRRQPYLDSFTVGIEHELLPGLSVGADLIHTENRDVLLFADLNPFSTAQGGRPNISILNGQVTPMSQIGTWVNAGENDYDALQISVRRQFDGRWGGRISITLADSEGNHEGGAGGTPTAIFQRRTETGYNFDTGEIIGEPLDLGLDDPRTNDVPVRYHRDVNVVLSGSYRVPRTSWRENGGLVVSGIYRFMTGDQVTLFDNSARLDNGNRAPAPPGTYNATIPSDIAQNGTSFTGRLRGAENPDFSRFDLSLQYDVPLSSRYEIKLQADIFNLFDETNFASLGGTRVGLSSFLIPTSALNPREFQLGIKFQF